MRPAKAQKSAKKKPQLVGPAEIITFTQSAFSEPVGSIVTSYLAAALLRLTDVRTFGIRTILSSTKSMPI